MASQKHHNVKLLGFYATNILGPYMLSNLHCAPKFSRMRTSVLSKICATKNILFYQDTITKIFPDNVTTQCLQM